MAKKKIKIEPFITDADDEVILIIIKKMVDAKWSFEDMRDEFTGAVEVTLEKLGRKDLVDEYTEDYDD